MALNAEDKDLTSATCMEVLFVRKNEKFEIYKAFDINYLSPFANYVQMSDYNIYCREGSCFLINIDD